MLSDGKRAWWRVAAYVTNVYREPFGPIGFVDVDATSGEVLSGDEMAQELQRGAHLERHPLTAGD
jgi:isopentenyl phosphate kinase